MEKAFSQQHRALPLTYAKEPYSNIAKMQIIDLALLDLSGTKTDSTTKAKDVAARWLTWRDNVRC